MIRKNLHLYISLAIVIPAAFVYGLSPDQSLPILFDFQVQTTDLKNVFRAIMGLYLSFSIIWLLGIVQPKYWTVATSTNMLFMLGLASGRLISLLVDGIPSIPFLCGLIGEFMLGIFGIFQLRKYSKPEE